VVRVHPDPPKAGRQETGRIGNVHCPAVPGSVICLKWCVGAGAIAQLGEHLLCKQGVGGSIPPGSTSWPRARTEEKPSHPRGSASGVANRITRFRVQRKRLFNNAGSCPRLGTGASLFQLRTVLENEHGKVYCIRDVNESCSPKSLGVIWSSD
jgi:hypothetical protein